MNKETRVVKPIVSTIINIDKKDVTSYLEKDTYALSLPNYRVYKHNSFVECRSDFTAIEHRIIVLALAQITAQDDRLKMYRINIKDVLGKDSASHYDLVRRSIKKLNKSTIDMDEKDGWKSYAFITKAQGKYGKNYIEVQFHEEIQRFLLGLKSHYTSYTLQNVINFKKNYSLRIYELCKQFQRIGVRTLKLDYLKTLLSLDNKYALFSDFRRTVLNPAIDEINRFSDLEVSFKEIRDGRAVESIKFFMMRKQGVTELEGQTLEEVAVQCVLKKRLMSLGFASDDFYIFREKYGAEKISGVFALFDKNIETIKFPKAWIEHALDNGFVDASEYKNQLKEESKKVQREKEKIREIMNKRLEATGLKEALHYMNIDLEFYKNTGTLKPGDVMRYSAGVTVEQAIEIMGKRIQDFNALVVQKQKELEDLERELDAM